MIDSQLAFLLGALFFAASVLYSSVGHGGASGYLAAMGLFGIAPAVMRPTALVMNIAVASISLYKFSRSSGFNWRLFWPFAVTAVPMAFVGGRIQLPILWFGILVGCVLLFSAIRLFLETLSANKRVRAIKGPPPIILAVVLGAAIGLLSGLTGVGGGIFLSPLLVLSGWATVRDSAAPTAAFVLVNSVSGLLGLLSRQPTMPDALPYWVAAVIVGGLIGASYGSRRLGNNAMRQALAVVLVIAGAKMIFK
ncbi:MAG TPA: sulfite exporter TauE/SafE family protein [Burkholderiaceae bacterium]|nr:sulfite exporter TauE/SafE family protein [Burkholderiaceae bacterium]